MESAGHSVSGEANLWFTCPAAWRSPRRSSAPPGLPGGDPRFSFDWGEMNPPQSKVLPPAKRLYAPCGAARRRRAQENAQAWKSAGHSVSGARSQSVVYLPSCLAISSAKFRPTRQAGRGAPIFIRLGRNESAPIQGFASGKTLVRAMRRGRRRRAQNAQAWKSAGHSVSGARRQSVVYLPSCLAISSAKFSCFFSMPSPFSKRTAFLKVMVPPRVLATEAIYCSTVMALSFTNSCCSRQFSL